MSETENTLIGYVTSVRGSGMQARIIGTNNKGVIPNASDFEQLPGQIGSYVIIKQSNLV